MTKEKLLKQKQRLTLLEEKLNHKLLQSETKLRIMQNRHNIIKERHYQLKEKLAGINGNIKWLSMTKEEQKAYTDKLLS